MAQFTSTKEETESSDIDNELGTKNPNQTGKENESNGNKVDFRMYQETANECGCDGNNIAKCISLKRIRTALKYYETMNILKNKNDQKIFTHFMKEVYGNQVHNDYIHIVCKHNHQIEEIQALLVENQLFSNCNLSKCLFTSRHHNDMRDEKENKNTLDPFLNLIKERFDSLHFYFFHLFECGLRFSTNNDNDDEIKDGDEVLDDLRENHFDEKFAKLVSRMNETQSNTERFQRMANNQKFNIKINSSQKKTKLTFLDQMMKNIILEIGIKQLNDDNYYQILTRIKQLVNDEEFESDTIKHDISKINGNICDRVDDKRCKNSSMKETVDADKFVPK